MIYLEDVLNDYLFPFVNLGRGLMMIVRVFGSDTFPEQSTIQKVIVWVSVLKFIPSPGNMMLVP